MSNSQLNVLPEIQQSRTSQSGPQPRMKQSGRQQSLNQFEQKSPLNLNMSYSTEPANWKKFLTALVGILAVFFGLIPRSTYCDVSVMKYICFRHLINVGVFSVLFITVILLSKMLLGKKFEIKSKWYIAIVVLFVVSLALNFAPTL